MVAILDFQSEHFFFFFLFLIYKSPQSFLLESIGLSVQKWKLDIQEGHHGRHLGFTVWTILLFFYLQVTPMLPTKFRANWP